MAVGPPRGSAMSEDFRSAGARAMKEIQIPRKEIQIFRNEIQAEAEQIPNPAERNPNSDHLLSIAFSKTCAKPSQAFLHFCADSGFECRGNVGVACSPRVARSFGLCFRFLRSSRASEGLAPFLRSRIASLRDAWARFPPDPSAAEPRCARRGTPASMDPRAMSPETEDPRIKTGRSIRCAARIRPLE